MSVIRTRVNTLRCPRVLRKPFRRFFLNTRSLGPRASPATTRCGSRRTARIPGTRAPARRRSIVLAVTSVPPSFAALVAIAGLGVALIAPGNADTATAICTDLAARGFDATKLCDGGAILWLGHTLGENIDQVASGFPMYQLYIPMALFSSLPYLGSEWLRRNRVVALTIVAAILPMFVIANDYGRWIHLIVMQLAIVPMVGGRPLGGWRWSALTAVPFVALWGFAHWTNAWAPTSLVTWLIDEVVRLQTLGSL